MLQSQIPSFKDTLALHEDGQLEHAQAGYHHLLQHEPDNHVVMNALACVYQGLGQNLKALEFYQKAANTSQETSLYKFNTATTLMNLNRDDDALATWDKYIAQVPNNASAYQNRAWIYWYKKNMLEKASADYQQALKYDAENISIYSELIEVLMELGETQEAEKLIAAVVTLASEQEKPENHKLLAISFMNLRRIDDAINQWNQYLSEITDSAEGYSYRALLLREKGDVKQAQHDYQLAIAYSPDDIGNYCELGEMLWLHDKNAEMEIVLEHALEVAKKKGSSTIFKQLSITFDKLNLTEKALFCLQQCIDSESEDEDLINRCYKQIMYLYMRNNDNDKAKENCQKWSEHYPHNPIPTYFLNILNQKQPERAPAGYVAHEFDSFAETFDKTLSNLEYSAPQIIADNIAPFIVNPEDNVVLDLGCGTGLSGKAITQYSQYLEGVDLSQKMLDKAKTLNVYDKLAADDFINYLADVENRYDLVIAADSLVYLGDLEEVIAKTSQALKIGGIFSCTLEMLKNTESPWQVHLQGRFSHNQNYINNLLAANNLDVRVSNTCSYRKDRNKSVDSLIIVAIKQ